MSDFPSILKNQVEFIFIVKINLKLSRFALNRENLIFVTDENELHGLSSIYNISQKQRHKCFVNFLFAHVYK